MGGVADGEREQEYGRRQTRLLEGGRRAQRMGNAGDAGGPVLSRADVMMLLDDEQQQRDPEDGSRDTLEPQTAFPGRFHLAAWMCGALLVFSDVAQSAPGGSPSSEMPPTSRASPAVKA